ncbi:MAG: alpha/beta hydrolase-fold protein [Phycisphaerales bacterium JB039]
MREITACVAIGAAGLASLPAMGQTITRVDAGRGPVDVLVPTGYTPAEPAPVIVLLHGYTDSGAAIEAYTRMGDVVEDLGFLLALPDGTRDILGNRFWNATDACCDLFGQGPDDVGYLTALLDTIEATFSIDTGRVFFAGHSNGGFMSYRMACALAGRISAVASLAGATYETPGLCAPSQNVHTLEIHGTSDGVIRYTGGCTTIGCYPGAVQTAQTWATYNGCSLTPDTSAPPIDLDASRAGAETTIARYIMGCAPGGSAELWTIDRGAHSPPLTDDFARLVAGWLLDHGRDCYADCDGSGALDLFDFLCFQSAFGRGDLLADCDGTGELDLFDFLCFQTAFGVGCG